MSITITTLSYLIL